MKKIPSLVEFVDKSPTIYHVIENISELVKDDFKSVDKNFALGNKYIIKQLENALVLISLPHEITSNTKINVVSAHGDSPSYKLKPKHISSNSNYVVLGVEPYGGVLASSWFDRPLGIAGIVYYQDNNKIYKKLVDLDTLVIPHVAIHILKEVKTDPNVDLRPILASKEKTVLKDISEKYNIEEESILSFDLALYNKEKGFLWGKENEFITSPRLDDLQCVYAGLRSIIESKPSNNINVLAVFDKEEIGSRGIEGADSQFLPSVLKQIRDDLKIPLSDFKEILKNSLAISADNAHAVHPNHPELTDEENKAFINSGVVIKYNAGLSYQTNAYTSAIVKKIFLDNDIPFQEITNKPGLPGGGTLGVYITQHQNIPTIDIGLAQLAMHSVYETAGTKDTEYLIDFLTKLYLN
jgi:aspartyl aminopeptidase